VGSSLAGTWQQRFFVRADYWNNATGPVFVVRRAARVPIACVPLLCDSTAVAAHPPFVVCMQCVGGEGPPLDASVLTASVHCNDAVELAASQHALLLALEHRYYGESIPVPDFTTANMAYLSSHQALADLATFHAFAAATFGVPSTARWVTFGGSYPGMMSAWTRCQFPHLYFASVSSSAPVQAQADFQGYNNVVAASMAAPVVGGSSQCAQAIADGHSAIGASLARRRPRRCRPRV
jgi:hypothetical protein